MTEPTAAPANDLPSCDTCKLPAVWSEFHGWRHSTDEFRFGVPTHLDQSGHTVTAKEWWDTPPAWADRSSSPVEGTTTEAGQ